jgi:hypothetical protein
MNIRSLFLCVSLCLLRGALCNFFFSYTERHREDTAFHRGKSSVYSCTRPYFPQATRNK